mgnify:CR=1 FL=1
MFQLNNLTDSLIDRKFFYKIVKKVLEGEKSKDDKELSIVLVGARKMRELNKKYRKKNKATDVLAFSYGEIVICVQEVKKNAKKYKLALKEELARVLIHGILHLSGYNHEAGGKEEKKMKEREENYLLPIKF